jgi:hypothetical protein
MGCWILAMTPEQMRKGHVDLQDLISFVGINGGIA